MMRIDILLLMVEQSPEALRDQAVTRVLSFVGKYAKHYAVPREVRYKPEPEYL